MATDNKKIEKKKKKDSVGRGLYTLYILFLICSLLLICRLVFIQAFYKPDDKVLGILTPTSQRKTIEPSRGAILSDDGRLLAMSLPIYDIHMDCSVKKSEYTRSEKGDSLENAWKEKAGMLAEGLAAILKDKTVQEYRDIIMNGRENGKQFVSICNGIERKDYNKIIQLPLFNEGQYAGGIIVDERTVRKYPYGKLARRTIGFVRSNSAVDNTHVGIEGKFDYVLHGTDGVEYLRQIDNKERVLDSDSTYVKAEDGLDIRTTINIDMQDIADKALREQLEDQAEIEGGCLVLMEVETGAIKAMVNLTRDSLTTKLEELQNFAIGRRCEPGSVFKTVTLTSALSDGIIKSLDDKMPTNHGRVKNTNMKQDVHILDWEREHKTDEISIIDGFKISSNYVFGTLAVEGYAKKPKQFIDNVYMYKLGEAFDFDIDGLRTPVIPSYKDAGWSNTTLGTMGFGYATEETPLHILTFYNALANKGRMMKPYIVESIEKYGAPIEKRGPTVLNASICSKAVADTVARALEAVTEEGTARRLKGARCTVGGKTGTSFAVLSSGTKTPYVDKYGRHKYQGTFVGFFPVEDPKYSIICVVYSHPTHNSFQGGGLPAMAVRTVVDEMYVMSPTWGERLSKSGSVPSMKAPKTIRVHKGEVPDVKGMGLSDAIFAIENAGFKCHYSGMGHVRTQSPAPGINAGAGSEIRIVLK